MLLRKIVKRLLWPRLLLVFVSIGFLFGCAPRVRLPEAPPYPQEKPLSPAVASYREALMRQYTQEEESYWQQMADCWGVQHLWGRAYLHLKLTPNQPTRCEIRRVALESAGETPTASWKALYALQRDGEVRMSDANRLVPKLHEERQALISRCRLQCPRLPNYSGSDSTSMTWIIERKRSALSLTQKTPPPPRPLPPAPRTNPPKN